MRPPLRLDGVFSVLPTAFRDDGSLDLEGTAALAMATHDAGVAGLTVLGVMGEATELSTDERTQVLATVRAAVPDLPIVVGVSGEAASVVSDRAGDAARSGVDGLMVSPSAQVGLAEAVAAAAAGGLPIVIQDYPAGSGVNLDPTAIGSVADGQPLVVGVKAEGPPTSDTIAALRQSNPGLALFGGLGGLFLIDELRAGANGTMTGFAMPERLVAIVDAYRTDPGAAEHAWGRLLPLMRLEAFPPFSLAARKEVWRLKGVIGSSFCRRAGARLDDQSRADVRLALAAVTA